ncbi:MAG: hypothetical protein H6Q12_1098 [Bacteroidetes bacterium]|nr:hypothetical protein [Bacteroidota bacterium]
MKGICALTKKEAILRQSHIYPKFVIEWMKETGSPYLRRGIEPNRRYQDGYKLALLSEEGEQMFSLREKWFAEKVFVPFLNDSKISIKYGEELYYFAISMLWRILVLELESDKIEEFKYYQLMLRAEEQWREFLYKGIYPIDFDNIHMMLADRIQTHDYNMDGVEYYFCRQCDGTTIYSNEKSQCVIYVKFARFFFFGILDGWISEPKIGIKIHPINGSLSMFDQSLEIDPFFGIFIKERIAIINEMCVASPSQQEKISENIKGNGKFLKSEAWDILQKDYNRNT